MKEVPVLRKITIYPFKSLNGISLEKAMIGEGGCIVHDREFALFDEQGKYINGKNNPLVHSLRSAVNFGSNVLSFRHKDESDWNHFHYEKDREAMLNYLSGFFNIPVFLKRDGTGRFLDLPDKGGVTVLSTSSLQLVSGWYDGLPLEETRSRFRANLEIDGVNPFWEDRLFSKPGSAVAFRIGDVTIQGMSPCARCVVPSRHPENGETIPFFQKSFTGYRSRQKPEWSVLNKYDHYYFMSVNCYIAPTETGKWINCGDPLNLIAAE